MRSTEHNSRAVIATFLATKRIAAVGVSSNPRDFTRSLMKDLVERGYDIIPVNPAVSAMDGRPCYHSVSDIQPPVDAALLLTPPTATEQVVHECAASGIGLIWMHRGGGTGAVSKAAVEFCREHSIKVIVGECPLMFLPQSGWPHRFHGFLRKITGAYPQ